MTEKNDEWMTVREVAMRFRVSQSTIQRLIRAGTLPATRLPGGRLLRIRPADVEMLLGRTA